MHARRVLEADGLAARQPNGAILCLDLDVVLRHTRQFDQSEEVIALLENVDGWECPHARRGTSQPIAVETSVERSLQAQQGVKRIEGHHGDNPPAELMTDLLIRWSRPEAA